MLDDEADLPHPVPGDGGAMPWKENWCFAAVDPAKATALLWHVSLRPADEEGIFTCKLDGPDLRVRHVGRHPLPPGRPIGRPLGDARMQYSVVEPHRHFALAYRGDDGVEIDAEYTARFAPFDFADGTLAPGRSPIGELGRHVFPFHHYEQALSFTATVRRPGHDDVDLAGWANRDHSWGRRDDFGFRSHQWICASFDDAYVQGSTMVDTTYPDRKFGGFVSSDDGNDPVSWIDLAGAYWDTPADAPLPPFDRDVDYVITTSGGQRIELTAHLSERFRILYLNARHPDRSQVYQDAQIFCPFTRHDPANHCARRGAGLLELGKHLAGEGVADRVR